MKTFCNALKWVLCVLYGGLTLFASVSAAAGGTAPGWAALIMGIGSVGLLAALIFAKGAKWYLACLPLLALQAGALLDGLATGSTNWLHHAVRLAVSAVLLLLFYATRRTARISR